MIILFFRRSHSIILWRYYINYEVSKKNLHIAKGIFYRAIRFVPWSKNLWMDSMREPLRKQFTSTELHDLLTLMTEKEIRIRKLPNTE